MSGLSYTRLQEEPGPGVPADEPWTADFSGQPTTSLTDHTPITSHPENGLPPNDYGGLHGKPASASGSHENSTSSPTKQNSPKHQYAENVKYTPLRPTGARELENCDVEREGTDNEPYESYVRVALTTEEKRKTIPKIPVIICALLCACVAIIGFGVIYVFIILPAQRHRVIYPDGKTHAAELQKMKSLGKNVAMTSCGLVEGTYEDGAYVFKGIPYALPPTGSRRWKPPTPKNYHSHTCWEDVLNATQFGSKCVQPYFNDTNDIEGREDCLYLNVWTPTLNPDTLLPVMVWLHSGDFVYGSGHMPGMSPNPEITIATNSVFVSFNYRLGAFGFLALDELRERPRGAAGNYGFMDQQLALTWVKDNIRHFGGDENMVTIFGHGSGATSVQAMMMSADSTGLFHKAWLTTPVALLNKTVDQACEDNKVFLTKSGCNDVHCLRKLTPLQVSRSSPWSLKAHWTLDQLFNMPDTGQMRNDLPIFDGHVVHRISMTNGPVGPTVPVILGATYFDLSGLESEQAAVNLTWDQFDDIIVHYVSPLGTDAAIQSKTFYSHKPRVEYTSPTHFPPLPSAQFSRLIGDIKTVCPVKILTNKIVSLYKQSTTPVYMYIATIYPSHNIKLSSNAKDSFVGWDIAAFFNSFSDLDFLAGQGDVNFQNILREEVESFVKAGKPDAARWRTAEEGAGLIGGSVTVSPVTQDYFDKCNFWKDYGFFRYTWSSSR